MAEFASVGLASSIVTFLDVSATVLRRLHQYHSTARDAPYHFRETATNLVLCPAHEAFHFMKRTSGS
jgi:hypothetical protein